LNINISEPIRRALEREVCWRKLINLEERLRRKHSILAKIDVDKVVRLICGDREAR